MCELVFTFQFCSEELNIDRYTLLSLADSRDKILNCIDYVYSRFTWPMYTKQHPRKALVLCPNTAFNSNLKSLLQNLTL